MPGCADARHQDDNVSFEDLDLTLGSNDCDHEPVIVLACNHVLLCSQLDQYLRLDSVYERGAQGWISCLPLDAGLGHDLRCPYCRNPVYGTFRYGRMAAKLFLDRTNKKWIPWIGRELAKVEARLLTSSNDNSLKKLEMRIDKLRVLGPAGDMTEAALHALGGSPRELAFVGIPSVTVAPRLRRDLLKARCVFLRAPFSEDQNAFRARAMKLIDDVVNESDRTQLGRVEAEARICRASFFLARTSGVTRARRDLNWILQHPLATIRDGPLAQTAKQLLTEADSAAQEDLLKGLNSIMALGSGTDYGSHWKTCPNGHPYGQSPVFVFILYCLFDLFLCQ